MSNDQDMTASSSPLLARLTNSNLALVTRHGKEKLLAPLLEPALGCHLLHIDSVDTDALGTFTREISRRGSQREAARQKAALGIERSGSAFSLASEGAFVQDPWSGILPWNIEMVLLLDAKTGQEIIGMAQGPATCFQQVVRDWPSLQRFAAQAEFPSHHLALRPDYAEHPAVVKGIDSLAALRAAFAAALTQSRQQQVFVESDLRAHCNPSRQQIIVKAAENLIARLQSICPACGAVDFWISGTVKGKPCRACGSATSEARAERWRCPCCQHEALRDRPLLPLADPANCERCNP